METILLVDDVSVFDSLTEGALLPDLKTKKTCKGYTGYCFVYKATVKKKLVIW